MIDNRKETFDVAPILAVAMNPTGPTRRRRLGTTLQLNIDGETGMLLQRPAHTSVHTRSPQMVAVSRRRCDIERSRWIGYRTRL